MNRTRKFPNIDRVNVRGLDKLKIRIIIDPSLSNRVIVSIPMFKGVQIIHPWMVPSVEVTTTGNTRGHEYEVVHTPASKSALETFELTPKDVEPTPDDVVEVTVESLTLVGSDRRVVVEINDKELEPYPRRKS